MTLCVNGPNTTAADLCHTAIPKVEILIDFGEQPGNIESLCVIDKIVHSFVCVSLVFSWIHILLPILNARNTDSEKIMN